MSQYLDRVLLYGWESDESFPISSTCANLSTLVQPATGLHFGQAFRVKMMFENGENTLRRLDIKVTFRESQSGETSDGLIQTGQLLGKYWVIVRYYQINENVFIVRIATA